MTKKKRRQNPEIDELLARPWCYYCERDFEDLKILIHHQKAKHFKCDRCARRLNTAGGLRVHMEQVHKETLEQVENALPGRESIDLEIFGTEGIPETEVAAHKQRIMAEFAQQDADRRAASGQSNGPKKPKIDISKELDPEEIKRKLEAHKKAMASGGLTPIAPGANMSPGRSHSPAGFDTPQVPPQVPPQGPYQPPATSSPPFQQNQFASPQSSFAPPNTYPTAFPPQPPATYQPTQYAQPPYQQQSAPFGRGGGGPHPSFSGYPQQQAGFGAPPFGGPPHGHLPQGAPPHVQQQPRLQPQGSSLPQPHQIPGLPPKPSVPGLPPRPTFTNTPSGFGRGLPPGATPTWNPPLQPHGFAPAGSPPPANGFASTAPPYGVPGPSSQPPQFGSGFAPPPRQSPPGVEPHGSTLSAPPPPSSATKAETTSSAAIPEKSSEIPVAEKPVEPAASGEKGDPAPKPKRETKLIYEEEMSPDEKRASLPQYSVYLESRTAQASA